LTATGGTTDYTYLWSNGVTEASINDVPAGAYMATVTDANQCTTTTTVEVTEPTALVAEITDKTNVICNDDETGSATVAASGGTTGYTYSWPSGGNEATEQNLSAGNYTVSVTDANGCETTTTVEITSFDDVPPVAISKDLTVSLDADGNATITADDLDDGSSDNCAIESITLDKNTFDCSNIGNNTITLTVTDKNGNSTTTTSNVLVEDKIAPTVTCPENMYLTNCPDVVEFDLPIVVENCSGWAIEQTEGLASGEAFPYGTTVQSFLVTDASGHTATCSFEIELENTLVTIVESENVKCFGAADGSATSIAAGGNPDYSYQWNDPNQQTTQTATDLAPGEYEVLVTDNEGCATTETVTITEPEELVIQVDQTTPELDNNSDGSINVSITGGTGTYTFEWTFGSENAGNTEDISGLSTGNYTLVVTDENGCTKTVDVVVDHLTGVIDKELALSISIFPNPSSGKFLLEMNGLSGETQFEIFDITGRKIFELVKDVSETDKVELNLKSETAGVYLLKVNYDSRLATKKLIIQ